jgi:signal transduction histidine kinase/CheY-like chemotaxis protein
MTHSLPSGGPVAPDTYRQIFDMVDAGFCIVEVMFDGDRVEDYRFLAVNRMFEQQTGLSEPVGRTARELVPGLEQHWYDAYGQVALTGEPARFESGSDVMGRWFEVQALRVGEPDQRRICILFTDISEQRRSERTARDSKERLQQALSAGHGIGTWDWDVKADLIRADERFARLYGVDPVRAEQGAPIADFFGGMHPEDLVATQDRITQTLISGGEFVAEYRLVQDDGSIRWVAAQGQCQLDDDGRPLRFPGVSFDITEQKRAAMRQSTLLELGDRIRDLTDIGEISYVSSEILGRALGVSRAGYGVIDTDAETITIDRDWNAPGVTSIAGVLRFREYGTYIEDLKAGRTVTITDAGRDQRTCDKADTLRAIAAASFVNMPLLEQGRVVALVFVNSATPRPYDADEIALIREVAARVRAATERVRAEEARRESEEQFHVFAQAVPNQIWAAHPDGGLYWFNDQVYAYSGIDRGGLVGRTAWTDIVHPDDVDEAARTRDLMAAEEALRQSQKMEAVGQLTGGIAHDFNNLLTGIIGSLELLGIRIAQGRLADVERYSLAAQGAAKRAASLTHRLLAFSRRQTLDPKPTDMNRLIAGMEELIRRTIGPAIELETVAAGGLWPTLVDPNQLENALLNLCINARDAMPDGGRLTIESGNRWLDARAARDRDLEPGQYVSLCVSDTGTGMTPEVIAKAFDPFFTTKPLGVGTGLGLSMIYGFTRQSGGQVRIYSEPGEGTMVCLYLPRHRGAAEGTESMPDLADAPRTNAGETVLVVDDEPTVRMLVVEVLEELGYIPIEAADGAAGLKILQSGVPIDLLVTDVGLPGGMNGRQMADAARLVRPGLKTLFITGYAENAVVGNGLLDAGMHVMTKPFAMEALAARIRELIQMK